MKNIKSKNINFELLIIVFLFLYMGFIYFSIALSNIFLGIGIFFFLFAWIGNRIQMDYKNNKILLFLLLIIPFLLTIISVLHSENLSNAMGTIRLRLPILITTFILIFMKIKDKTIKKGISVFISLTFFATLYTFFNASNFIDEGVLFQPDFTFFIMPIQHPYFGVFLLVAFVSLIEFRLIHNNILRNIILFILCLGILISTSRLAYLLLFSIVIFYSLIKLSKRKSILILISLIVFSVLFLSINKNIQVKFKTSFIYQNSPRLKLWNNAFKVVTNSENKFIGIGVGDYYEVKKDPYYYKEQKEGIWGYDPHSQLLDFYITTGYFGILSLIVFLLYAIFIISKQNRYAKILFSIVLIFSLTESILNRQYGVQLYSIFIPLIFKDNFNRLK